MQRHSLIFLSLACIAWLAACGGGGGSGGGMPSNTATPTTAPTIGPQGVCNGSTASASSSGPAPVTPNGISVPAGFAIQVIANVGDARELAALPNGDLLVATNDTLYIVPNAESSGAAGAPVAFAHFNDTPAVGVTFVQSSCTIYVGAQHGIYEIPYHDGQLSGTPVQIASVRTGSISPTTDGDVHVTTSVAFAGGMLYASVGSSCNSCTEVDPTRASIQVMNPNGSNMTTRATRIRNGIALAVNPVTGTLWAGGAGQDSLPVGHPYEYFDPVSLHPGVADYGWPQCEENQVAYASGANCSSTVVPRVEMKAYSTIIGAAFYPQNLHGSYAFPSSYAGGAFLAAHGSWHDPNAGGVPCASPAQVVFVAMNGDTPVTPVNWSDPTAQDQGFVTGFQTGCYASNRIGRPTGVTIGAKGSLFVGDDQNGLIYRIRPGT